MAIADTNFLSWVRARKPITGWQLDRLGRPVNTAEIARHNPASIARGDVPGVATVDAMGRRDADKAETNQPITPVDSGIHVLDAGGQMSVQSTSADDTAGGTGARAIRIHYLDTAGVERSEDVALNGTTAVLTTATDIMFVQCQHLTDAGGGGAAAGDISTTNDGAEHSRIKAGDTRCTSSWRMVPAGKRLVITDWALSSISATSDSRSVVKMASNWILGELFESPRILFSHQSLGAQNGGDSAPLQTPLVFPAGALVGATHTSNKAGTTTAAWRGYYEDA